MSQQGAGAFEAIRHHPVVRSLVQRGLLAGFAEVPREEWPEAPAGTAHLVRHASIPFITYPYEWPFEMLRAAALLHLDLHLELLAVDLTLSDASAYNVQFIASAPVFIDLLSIRPYREGEYWLAHDQFMRQFLNPLLLESWCDVGYAAFYRGALEGIATSELARLLPWRARLRPSMQFDVLIPARFADGESGERNGQGRPFPKSALVQLLHHLRRVIAGLRPSAKRTTWTDYAVCNTYSAAAVGAKEAFVRDFIAAQRPASLLDLGCNDGQYAAIAVEAGAGSVIGIDSDRSAANRAFLRARRDRLALLVLNADLANLSPAQGWRLRERRSLVERLRPDALLALAVTHHLAIGRNIPIDEIVDALLDTARAGIVEVVPKSDPMIRKMLSRRDDIFPDYGVDAFRTALSKRAPIIREETIPDTQRVLVWYGADPERR